MQARKTRWTHYQIAYHFVWIPKYRRKILVHECAEKNDLTILALETDQDHVHVFVSAAPRYSPAQIANLLKGYTSRFLRQRFPFLKKKCGKDQLWTQAYYVGTAGQVTTEIVRKYIMDCQGK